MSEECYALRENTLTIHDPEMQIALSETFEPVRIPAELDSDPQAALPKGSTLRMSVDEENRLTEVSLEKEGKRHGQSRLYYPSGAIKSEAFYWEGVLHGPSVFFSEEGTVLSESWFFHGRQQGKAVRYYGEGALYCTERYRDGVFDGIQEYFYSDGNPKTVVPFDKGAQSGEVLLYHPNGQISRKISFAAGRRQGIEQQWASDGTMVLECEYDGPDLVGTSKRWHPNGQLAEQVTYHLPSKCDVKQWNCEGVLLREAFFDEQDRYFHRVYDLNGQLKEEQQGHWDGRRLCAGPKNGG